MCVECPSKDNPTVVSTDGIVCAEFSVCVVTSVCVSVSCVQYITVFIPSSSVGSSQSALVLDYVGKDRKSVV